MKGSILAQNAEQISSDVCPAESFYDPSIGSYQQPLSEEVLQQVCRIPATGYAIKACMSYCAKGQFQTISEETCYRAQTIKDLGIIWKLTCEKKRVLKSFVQRENRAYHMDHTHPTHMNHMIWLNLNASR